MNIEQLDIFTGAEARDAGIAVAIDHANSVHEGWSDKAYGLLLKFLSLHPGKFMAEDVRRYAAILDFPMPPNARAWGSIMLRAAKEGMIRKQGYGQVKNPRAHMATAAVWTHNVPFAPADNTINQ